MAPLIVITGPTASGKTGLALELARRHDGEIICADSRTIYKGMDIGTAKPTPAERQTVPHHGLDLVEPGARFTARDFQRYAIECIADIRSRGKVPLLVGGTGLYIDAVVREYEWPDVVEQADEYEQRTIGELQMMIKKQRLPLPVNAKNRRHLINVLRRNGTTGRARPEPHSDTFVVAIATEKTTLRCRIERRAEEMFAQGVIDEATRLAAQYGWDSEAMTGNIYPIIREVLEGKISEQQAIATFVTRDMQLVKRQLSWLRRHDYVTWLPLDEAGPYIETRLREMC